MINDDVEDGFLWHVFHSLSLLERCGIVDIGFFQELELEKPWAILDNLAAETLFPLPELLAWNEDSDSSIAQAMFLRALPRWSSPRYFIKIRTVYN